MARTRCPKRRDVLLFLILLRPPKRVAQKTRRDWALCQLIASFQF